MMKMKAEFIGNVTTDPYPLLHIQTVNEQNGAKLEVFLTHHQVEELRKVIRHERV